MSFLAPLYIAGIAAIALPIIFHLIRRTPQNRQQFSSLMFLSPSPPRLSRRSRLTNIVLLILRAVALCLLAFAFARPFFYRKADLNVNPSSGRRIAVLVDTSASMRRGDLWDQAKNQVRQAMGDITPADQVALFFFDRQVREAFTFEQWNQTELSQRSRLLLAQLEQTTPSWSSTNLGEALSAVADQLAESSGAKQSNAETTRRQIVLVSDLQQGSHAETLQNHEWPEHVSLDVRRVSLKQTTNASLQLVKDSSDAGAANDKFRVRVSNEIGAGGEQFSVAWANEKGPIASIQPQQVYVPPGRSRVIRIEWPAPEQNADRLILRGDDFDFDNTLFVLRPRQEQVRVVYIGDDAPDDPKGLSYYLRNALADSPQRKVEFVQRRASDALNDADLNDAKLIVVSAALPDDRAMMLKRRVENSDAVLLWVLKDLAGVRGLDLLDAEESPATRDYSLIARVDLDHPLFAPFADARFGDFSKIHFWKHRRVKLSADDAASHVIAWFDDGDPFMIERSIGKGRMLIMTSGWQPADSQLALATKFVPLIGGMLAGHQKTALQTQYTVGERIPSAGAAADSPGVFRAGSDPYAVNLAADESRTAPLEPADLEHFGAKLGPNAAAPDVVMARQRQLQLFELENRQKMWRWLVLAVLGLVAAETLLAGRLARQSSDSSQVNTQEQVSA